MGGLLHLVFNVFDHTKYYSCATRSSGIIKISFRLDFNNIAFGQDRVSNVKNYMKWHNATVQNERKYASKMMKPCQRSPRPLSVTEQSDTSEKCISSKIKRHRKKRTKSPKWVSRAKSSKNSSMSILSRKKSLWRMKKKSSKLSVKLKTARTTSNSMHLSSPNKSHWRITKKHQQLHKLVFEEGGLPDGAEVAYYARGQKLLEGYKRALE
ncbi:hypothetical protein K1719_021555 [Acacia pycnantha]|nr:hypothetical protein K1719_021555 [Acacia pycnantha]